MRRLLAAIASLLVPVALAAQAAEPVATPVVPLPASTLPLKHAPERTSAGITTRDLMTRLYIFADDSMMGREAGTIGNVKGTDYIAREVKRLGLTPAGDSGGYFQTVPLKIRSVDTTSSLTVDGSALPFGQAWVGLGNTGASLRDVGVVFGGTLGDSAASATPEQLEGKLVVLNLPPGPGGRRAFRAAARMAGGAAAVAVIGPEQFMRFLRRPSTFVDDPAAPPASGKPSLLISPSAAAELFSQPIDQLTPGSAGKTVSLELRLDVAPVPFPARNVVAILPGSDARLRGEYVAIGAHNDHIGLTAQPVDHDSIRIFNHLVRPGGAEDGGKQATPEEQQQVNSELAAWRAAHPGTTRPDSISNGADDDGSGSVSVLEVAEKMASLKHRPKRSTIFVWHVGEEKGLLGSLWFTDHPTVPRDSIVAQLNMDMVGRGDPWDVSGKSKEGAVLHGGPDYLQVVGSRRLSTELGDLIEQVNTEGKYGFAFDYAMDANGHPMNIYCRSDHYEYARYGIPIAFFTTGGHSDYHQVTDEAEYIDYARMARVASLVEDIALHLGNLDHRIVVDKEKPDPHGSCQQ